MNRYALVVGINDYADVENIQPLRFAVEDARLVDRFFHACGFEVQALMDSEATCAAIERHLRDLSGRLQPNDLFLFYFSGHGYQWGVRGEERQYLLPRDADLWAMKHGGAGRAVPMRLVQECSGNRGARRVVILDACRSGLSPGEKGDAATEERLATKDIRAIASTAPANSPLVVVCSCRPGQLSYEHGGLRGGLFTNAFLSEFSQLQNAGRPVAFTSETNGAIATRMQRLAEKVHLDPGKVGTFWIEGDATALELLPARSVRPAPAPASESADPEQVEIKEWVVEDLQVELERVEIVRPATPSGLPPVPEAIVTLRSEIAGLEKAIAELKAGTHPSLKQAQAAVREAELQLKTFQEDLAAHEVSIVQAVRSELVDAVAGGAPLRPSSLCDLAPDIVPTELLSFVARLRNIHRAERALESVRNDLAAAVEREVADMVQQAASSQGTLEKHNEEDLRCILRVLRPSLGEADLIETWADVEPQLMARGYGWDSRTLLAKVEPFFLMTAEQACKVQSAAAEVLGLPMEITNSIGMKLRLIPAGEFLMGSPDSEKERDSDEGPQHRVRITQPFYFGVYEVTQEQYEHVMGTNPSCFKGSSGFLCSSARPHEPTRPVENVSWKNAVEFCRRVSALPAEQSAGREYRLPTEAEWEYACRAGTTTRYHFGNELASDQARFGQSQSSGCPVPVGSYSGNGFGLFDMHGNVWEWCADWFGSDYYASSPADDPQGPASGSSRVHRGGGWCSYARDCRSAIRSGCMPGIRGGDLGFRLVLIPTSPVHQ